MKKRTFIAILFVLLAVSACGPKRHFVISKVRSAAKLATTQTTIDKLVVGTKTKRLLKLVKISEAQFVASTKAYVKTGVDLEKLKSTDITSDGKMIDIKLPAVEVLDFSYPFKDFKIDSTITGNAFLNRFELIDYEEFYRRAELDIRENLQYTGIIEQTRTNTTRMVRGVLRNLGYEEIYISYYPTDTLFTPVKLGREGNGE